MSAAYLEQEGDALELFLVCLVVILGLGLLELAQEECLLLLLLPLLGLLSLPLLFLLLLIFSFLFPFAFGGLVTCGRCVLARALEYHPARALLLHVRVALLLLVGPLLLRLLLRFLLAVRLTVEGRQLGARADAVIVAFAVGRLGHGLYHHVQRVHPALAGGPLQEGLAALLEQLLQVVQPACRGGIVHAGPLVLGERVDVGSLMLDQHIEHLHDESL
jgi:hypothetical protein